jgi:hypothetical protein
MNPENNNQENTNNKEPFEIRDLGFFNGDQYFLYIYKKTEKLVTAIYLITNLFTENEPLKWSLRESGVCLLNDNVSLKLQTPGDRNSTLSKMVTAILEILSHFEIAFFAGLVSQMNYEILKRELISLVSTIEEKGVHKGSLILSNEFFNTNISTESIEESLREQKFDTKQLSVQGEIFNKGQNSSVLNKKDYNTKKGSGNTKDKEAHLEKGQDKKDGRRTIIIDLLRDGKQLTIKDFSIVIKDCSEKTIQRELLSLVAEGLLKKEGERRWSKYSLK